jgi:hypothetical protein
MKVSITIVGGFCSEIQAEKDIMSAWPFPVHFSMPLTEFLHHAMADKLVHRSALFNVFWGALLQSFSFCSCPLPQGNRSESILML